MSQGRLTCPRCGSNNFDTVTACWKCGNPLTAGAAAVPQPAVRAHATSYAQPVVAAAPVMAAPTFTDRAAAAAIPMVSGTGNPAAANRAAFWLGMLFPYFGFPIGLAFIMCDDRRRQEVGRLCVMWSLISSVVHLLLMFVSLLGMRQYIALALNMVQSNASRMGGGGLGGGGLGGGLE